VIARTDIDATHLMAACDEGIREPRKEGGRGALQEKDDAFGLTMHANDEATPAAAGRLMAIVRAAKPEE
jgi:hypothetical protein